MKTKGVVTQVSDKNGRFGIKIGETWYNGFGESPVKEGDEIEFEYEENPSKDGKMIFKNVDPEEIEVITSAPVKEQVGNIDSRARRRTDCLLRAHTAWENGKIDDWEKEAKKLIEFLNNEGI